MRASYTKWCRALVEIGVTGDGERKLQRQAHTTITPGWEVAESEGEGRERETEESRRGREQVKRGRGQQRKWQRDRERQGLKPGPQWEFTLSMKLTSVTFGSIGCEAVTAVAYKDTDKDFIQSS